MWQFLWKTNAQKAEGHIRIGVLVYVLHGGVKSFIKHKIIIIKSNYNNDNNNNKNNNNNNNANSNKLRTKK